MIASGFYLWGVLEVKYIAMVVQRRYHETYWVAPLRGSIPQSQQRLM